ncbi:hypothetical protein M0R45_006556 [Rubus argutus]|uniref:Uncharacterized protein n=1 Tax=Rubus argutus TaxID=59490 RepID=A0AAW1YQS8_RUBAR
MTRVMGIDGSFVDRRKRHGWVVGSERLAMAMASWLQRSTGKKPASAWQRRRRMEVQRQGLWVSVVIMVRGGFEFGRLWEKLTVIVNSKLGMKKDR